jgi:restriction system protein
MAIPPFEELIVPIVSELADGGDHRLAQIKASLATKFNITTSERERRLPSTPTVRVFDNRVLWAIQHIKIANLAIAPKRAIYRATPAGRDLADHLPPRIDRAWLVAKYPAARAYFGGLSAASLPASIPLTPASPPQPVLSPAPTPLGHPLSPDGPSVGTDSSEGTPEERMDEAVEEIRGKLTTDLQGRLASCDPTVFEIIVTRLVVKMGYAAKEEDILRLHGRSGDGGIDGIVQRDPLGLEQVYMQAKRWSSPVPLKPVVTFYEKVRGSGVRLGVFVARSGFNGEAREWIDDPTRPEHRASIAWIDGQRLAELMIRYEVGVKGVKSYDLQGIDENAFEPATD